MRDVPYSDPVSALAITKFIWRHPIARRDRAAAFGRFVRWQIGSRILRQAIVVPFIDDTRLVLTKGMTGATGCYYVGLMEFADMSFALHVLNESDLFVDVGANVGAYTVLATGVRGARSIAVEPLPQTARELEDNIAINGLESHVSVFNGGLGSHEGELFLTNAQGTTNHIVVGDEPGETVAVPIKTLDQLLAGEVPFLLKIDVEGYEMEVLAGAEQTLASEHLQAIIIELNGSGERYGVSNDALHDYTISKGFKAYHYNPFSRSLAATHANFTGNTIYIRDVVLIQKRLLASPPFRVAGIAI